MCLFGKSRVSVLEEQVRVLMREVSVLQTAHEAKELVREYEALGGNVGAFVFDIQNGIVDMRPFFTGSIDAVTFERKHVNPLRKQVLNILLDKRAKASKDRVK